MRRRPPKLLFVLVTGLLALLVSLVLWAGSDVPEDDQVSRSGVVTASEAEAADAALVAPVDVPARVAGATHAPVASAAPEGGLEAPGMEAPVLEVEVVDVEGNPVSGALVWAEGTFRIAEESWFPERSSTGTLRRTTTTFQSHFPGFGPSVLAQGETVEGRTRLRFASPAGGDSVRVFAGGPYVQPVWEDVDPEARREEPVRLVLNPYGTLEIVVEPKVDEAVLFVGRLNGVPHMVREVPWSIQRGILRLPMFGLDQELDVHVLGFAGKVELGWTGPEDDESGLRAGLVDLELDVRGMGAVHALGHDGKPGAVVFQDERRERRVHRIQGPSMHGETRRVAVEPGARRTTLTGTLVDAEGWNVGNFRATLELDTDEGLLRYDVAVQPLGDFTVTLPPEVVERRPRGFRLLASPSMLQDRPHFTHGTLPELGAGLHDLGAFVLEPMPLLVEGRVLDENGEPVPLRIVRLHALGPVADAEGRPTWTRLPGPASGRWRTDAEGRYRLHGIPNREVLAVSADEGEGPVPFAPPSLGLELVVPAEEPAEDVNERR